MTLLTYMFPLRFLLLLPPWTPPSHPKATGSAAGVERRASVAPLRNGARATGARNYGKDRRGEWSALGRGAGVDPEDGRLERCHARDMGAARLRLSRLL